MVRSYHTLRQLLGLTVNCVTIVLGRIEVEFSVNYSKYSESREKILSSQHRCSWPMSKEHQEHEWSKFKTRTDEYVISETPVQPDSVQRIQRTSPGELHFGSPKFSGFVWCHWTVELSSLTVTDTLSQFALLASLSFVGHHRDRSIDRAPEVASNEREEETHSPAS